MTARTPDCIKCSTTRRYAALAVILLVVLMGGSVYSASASSLPGIIAGYGGGWIVRPHDLALTATDGESITGLPNGSARTPPIHWLRWTKHSAFARGTLWVDPCTPTCASAKLVAYPATVLAYNPWHGHFALLKIRSPYFKHTLYLLMTYEPGFGGRYTVEQNPNSPEGAA